MARASTPATTNGAHGAVADGADNLGQRDDVVPINVPPPDIRELYIPLEGTAQLVVHRFDEKARRMILDAQMGKASAGREPKDPERDYNASRYQHPEGGDGFRAIAFKDAMVRAGTYLDMTMTYLRGAFHVVGEGPEQLVRIEGEPRLKEDPVRIGRGVADLRYRASYWPWRVLLRVRYNARAISKEQLLNLAQHAGFSVGVGEGRPEKNGEWGTFTVATRQASAGEEAA